MNTLKINALALAIGLAGLSGAFAQDMGKAAYKASEEKLEVDYKAAKRACTPLKANAYDICLAEAKATQKIGKSELYANYRPTERNRYNAAVAKANAQHSVANEKCDDSTGNAKDVCRKEAALAQTTATADAKAKHKIDKADLKAMKESADTRTTATKDKTEARKDASSEKNDAAYAVEKEKCDASSGDMKDKCIAQAKTRFGKS
jgi:hypothetical protein